MNYRYLAGGISTFIVLLGILVGLPVYAQSNMNIHGYLEPAYGVKSSDQAPVTKRNVLKEMRLMLQKKLYGDRGEVLDVSLLATTNDARNSTDLELREGSLFLPLTRSLEIKAGRQIMSWGPSQFEFINDHFTKDFTSFFIGRDLDFLKAPEDAVKLSYFSDLANVDLIASPNFEPDRLPRGQVVPVYHPGLRRLTASDSAPSVNQPEDSIGNGEYHVRLHQTYGRWETALYGYHGFVGQPAGWDGNSAFYPELSSAGFSLRGPFMGSIVWLEGSYDDVRNDLAGDTTNLPTDRAKLGVGLRYRTSPTVSYMVQAITAKQIDASTYRNRLSSGHPDQHEYRNRVQVATTRTYWSDRLTLTLRGFAGLTEEDWHTRTSLDYEWSDAVTISGGGLFYGADFDFTRFGAIDENDMGYVRIRYGF
jgi:hypothetical protein